MTEPRTDLGPDLLALLRALPELGEGRLRLAGGEADASEAPEPEAQTFLKLDGRRLGRDAGTYRFMGEVQGWEATLADFAMEVVLPLRSACPDAYEAAAAKMRELGGRIYGPDRIDDWTAIFDDGGGSVPSL